MAKVDPQLDKLWRADNIYWKTTIYLLITRELKFSVWY